MPPPAQSPTFAERYCRARGLLPSEYHRALLQEALYPHARPLAGLLRLLDRRHFVADYEFVEDVGHIRSVADFALPMGSYVEHPDNRGFLRRRLRLRTSTRHMLTLVRAAFAQPGVPAEPVRWRSLDPFDRAGPPPAT